jgi:rod shape determining protein RodA
LLKPYQKERIISFFFQKNSDSKLSWQQTQSKIAIGSGGIFGKGILKSTQGKLGFLPEAKTDFIFSVFAEEFGFFGVLVLFFLFFLLIKRILDVGLKKNSNFTRILSFAFGAQILSEVFINSAMNLGILPVIGVPFPFLSYGGSNLLLKFAFLGVLESIQTH